MSEYAPYGFTEAELRAAYGKVADSALAWAFGLEVVRKGWFSMN